MDKWEYGVVKYDIAGNSIRDFQDKKLKNARGDTMDQRDRQEYFTVLGEEGWELVSTAPIVGGSLMKLFGSQEYTTVVEYIFKRRKA